MWKLPRNARDSRGQRHCLVNYNLDDGTETLRHFLTSAEFTKEALSKLVGKHSTKADAVDAAVWDYDHNELPVQSLVAAYLEKPRTWLAFFHRGSDVRHMQRGTAEEFFTQYGEQQWYGPFVHAGAEWYVHALRVPFPVETGSDAGKRTFQEVGARWHVVVEIRSDYVAFHWDGFYVRDQDEPERKEGQFPYWKHIPHVRNSLLVEFGLGLTDPNLYQLILHTLLERYDGVGAVSMQHLRLRAFSEGVALNASGKKGESGEVTGVRQLTRNLAISALEALGVANDDALIAKLDRALLRTLLHEWGVRSYQVSIGPDGPEGFRATVYFGEAEARGADSLMHLNCYMSCGGSPGALRFLCKELADE